MNIDVNPSANNGSGYKKMASIAVIALLVFGGVGIAAFAPQKAFAAVSITASSSQWYGNGFVRILITDTAQNAVNDKISPHIDVKRGSNTLVSADPTINTPSTAGTFELYLTTSNGALNFLPASPSNPSDYDIGRINSAPHNVLGSVTGSGGTLPRDFNLTLASGDNLKDGDSVVISYLGQSTTIQFAKSPVVAAADRQVAGDGDKVTISLTSQNANTDPTAIDSFHANGTLISVQSGGGTFNFTNAKFIEEGQNNG